MKMCNLFNTENKRKKKKKMLQHLFDNEMCCVVVNQHLNKLKKKKKIASTRHIPISKHKPDVFELPAVHPRQLQ